MPMRLSIYLKKNQILLYIELFYSQYHKVIGVSLVLLLELLHLLLYGDLQEFDLKEKLAMIMLITTCEFNGKD